MKGLLSDKTAVVTGGSSGIGLATAQRFIDEGASVIVTGRRRTELDAAAAQLGPHAHAVTGDVTVAADLERRSEAAARLGGIDILFANARVARSAPLGSITKEDFQHLFDINVKGVVFTVQTLLPLIREHGSIILNSLNDADSTLDDDQFKAQRSQGIPLGRLATTDEVADAVVLLASGLSSFTTGAALPVDGGYNQI
ncbi:MAG TPA: SDR family oxidoreductase [Mycobacterium sp.]|nr:SDR family oxidoreductase [Mycobacterium sp.]